MISEDLKKEILEDMFLSYTLYLKMTIEEELDLISFLTNIDYELKLKTEANIRKNQLKYGVIKKLNFEQFLINFKLKDHLN